MSSSQIVQTLSGDLVDEHADLDRLLGAVPDCAWKLPTPAVGWDISASLSHLCFFDSSATLAAADPESFEVHRRLLHDEVANGRRPDVDLGLRLDRPALLLEQWREGLHRFIDTIEQVPSDRRVPWYGPTMSPASMVSARLMETWAHGVDIRDALSVQTLPSTRLRHICHIGYAARSYAFAAHGVEDPGTPVRLFVRAPDGATWAWGPAGADDTISGDALDVALVFTQRRHHRRTSVRATGQVAKVWIEIAQAFAGPGTVASADRLAVHD